MGARGPKPKENLGAMAGLISPLALKAPSNIKGGKEARAEYERLAKELAKLGHLNALHIQALVNYVEAWEIANNAVAEVNDEGITLESAETGNKYLHPALGAWSMAVGQMEKAAKMLGMTPLSLQSIKSAKKQPSGSKKEKDSPSSFLTGEEEDGGED